MASHFWRCGLLMLLLARCYPFSDATAQPTGVWPMSLASGRDVSGYNNHGTPSGLVFVDGMEGLSKSAVDFNGAGRHITISKLNGMAGGSFTLGAYIRVSKGPTTNVPIVSFQLPGSTSSAFIFGVTPYSKLRVYFEKTDFKTTDGIKPNTWTFVGISYNSDSGSVRIWMQDRTLLDMAISQHLSTGIGGAIIGGSHAASGDFLSFQGYISCVVLYSSALSPQDIPTVKRTCTSYDNSAMFSRIGPGRLPTGATLQSLNAKSAVDCSGECFANPACHSCSFSPLDSVCYLGNLVMDSSQLTTTGDYKTYNFGAKL